MKYRRNLLLKVKNYEKKIKVNESIIKEFRNINSNNLLLNKNKSKTNFPDITVIIIIYNQAHCLHKALRSIQNQSIKNLEILIIDDCSIDNSINLIKDYQKEDNRIVLIKHKENLGKIKSRSDGIKLAKGKYITVLDGDDALIHKDILLHTLYIANLGDLDIVEFKMIIYKNGTFRNWHNRYPIKTNDIVYQPELRTKFFLLNKDYRYRAIQNRNVCGKIIKNIVFKKAVKNIGPKYTEDYILSYEDTIMTVSLFQIAKSYYYTKENGYYYSRDDKQRIKFNNTKNIKHNKTAIRGIGQVILLQFLLEKTKNNRIERQLIFYEIMSINYYSSFYKIIKIKHDYIIIYNILKKMINSRFLSINQKKQILSIKNELKEKENKEKNNKAI
jgi:glycosyltransferase involved in cell wall biosynthesis